MAIGGDVMTLGDAVVFPHHFLYVGFCAIFAGGAGNFLFDVIRVNEVA